VPQTDATLTFDPTSGIPDFKGTLRTFMAPAHLVEFEHHFDIPLGRMKDEPERAEWVLWFIWRAQAQQEHLSASFEEWLNALVDYDLPEEAAAGPTEPPPPT